MNKYSLKDYLAQALKPHLSTFKATSFDDANNTHLCHDDATSDVYSFDAYVRTQSAHPMPASPDAIHIDNKNLYFVEFKNQRTADIDKTQMRRKFEHGTGILKKLLEDFTAKDCRYHFCVVLKNQPKPRFMDFGHIEQSAVKFGLMELNARLGGFYDKVYIEPLDFYVKEHKTLRCE